MRVCEYARVWVCVCVCVSTWVWVRQCVSTHVCVPAVQVFLALCLSARPGSKSSVWGRSSRSFCLSSFSSFDGSSRPGDSRLSWRGDSRLSWRGDTRSSGRGDIRLYTLSPVNQTTQLLLCSLLNTVCWASSFGAFKIFKLNNNFKNSNYCIQAVYVAQVKICHKFVEFLMFDMPTLLKFISLICYLLAIIKI